MSQLHGKQLRNESTSLNKLNGSGIVAFDAATMSFTGESVLTRQAPSSWGDNDIVNKSYVDSVVQGLDVKESVKVKTESSISLSGTQTIQTVSLVAGDRVLVNGQDGANPDTDNGIWVVAEGSWTRPDDFTGNDTVTSGAFVFVEEGDFADSGFVLVTDVDPIVVGTTAIKFQQFSGAGQVTAGTGLTKDGNTLNITDTTVSAGAYGSADSVSTFTVNAQGQLTAAGETQISILSSQVTDFNADVSSEVFDSANFVDTNSVDFTVTAGSSVTADVKVNSDGLEVTANGVSVKADGASVIFDGSGALAVDTSGITADLAGEGLSADGGALDVNVDNGLSIVSDNVELGGTLTKNTTIDGDNNDLSLTNLTNFSVSSDNGVYTDTAVTKEGLKYAADYSGSFVARSLVDKAYVDSAVTNSTYFADNGIELSGLTFSLASTVAGDGLSYDSGVLDINVDADALEIVSDEVRLKDTIAGNRTFSDNVTINGDLTVSGTVSSVNSDDLFVKDNVITLNDGESTAGVSSGTSGIEIDRGSSDFAKLIFDESDNLFYAGLSGSLQTIVTEAGTGLSKTDNVLNIDTTGFDTTLAGAGLTANSGALDVNVDNGISIVGDNVELGGTLTKTTTITGAGNDVTFTGLGDLSFSAQNGVYTDAGNTGGLRYAGDYSGNFVNRSLVDKEYVDLGTASLWSAIDDIQGSDIDEVTAGDGLTGGGTQGTVDVAVGDGAGIQVNADSIEVDITTGGGLTFSGSGNTGTLEVEVDGTTIDIVNGALTAVGGSAQPAYQTFTGVTATQNDPIGTLTNAPDEYSRVEVYVNGLKVVAQGNGGNLSETVSGASVDIDGTTLDWISTDYDIESTDVVEVVYEN